MTSVNNVNIFCERIDKIPNINYGHILFLISQHPVFSGYDLSPYEARNFYLVSNYTEYDGRSRNYIGFTNGEKLTQNVFKNTKLVSYDEVLEILGDNTKSLKQPFYLEYNISMKFQKII